MLREDVILIIEKLLQENSNRKLHISCNNGRFYNGVFEHNDDEDVLFFIDDKLGSYPILYSLIINIEPQRER